VFYGIAMGVVPMVVNTLVLERSSENRKGTATAAYTSAMDIGVGIGSIVLGSIVDAQGYTIAFVLSGIISLAALLIYMMTIMREDGKYNNAYH
jgi:predicted MFS family arabinose efflux permease